MPDFSKFDRLAPQMIADLMHDFGFSDWQAAAFVGNAAAESAYFTDITEDGAIAKGQAGGTGWFQWTGSRRRTFESWLARKGWSADSYLGNYSYLYRELKGYVGTEKKIVERVKSASTFEEAVRRVCAEFERPAVNNYEPRYAGATRALMKYRANPVAPTVWPTDVKTPVPQPVEPAQPDKEIENMAAAIVAALLPALVPEIIKAIQTAAARPETAIQPAQVQDSATINAIRDELRKAMANPPAAQVEQVKAALPPEQLREIIPPKSAINSTTVHGLLVGLIGVVGSTAGIAFASEDVEMIAGVGGSLVTTVGLLWAYLGRRGATQPLK